MAKVSFEKVLNNDKLKAEKSFIDDP